MSMKIFSVLDNKTHSYNRPFCETNEIMASRSLQMALADKTIQLSMFPQDFDLYLIGELDEVTGVITPQEPPKFIVSAVSLKKMEETNADKI